MRGFGLFLILEVLLMAVEIAGGDLTDWNLRHDLVLLVGCLFVMDSEKGSE